MSRRSTLALLLVVATCAVYARALGFDFISYDDPNYVTENEWVRRGFSGEGLTWAWTTGHAENWHPLTWMSHMLDVELFGLEPAGHHGTNVALHAVNTALLFLLLTTLTGAAGATGASAWVAGMFALHPLHVESVAWVAERKDLLSTAFALLAMLAYASFARRPRPAAYLLALLMLALSLASKPMYVTLPFVLLLLDCWPLERMHRGSAARLLLEKVPFLALVVAASVVTLRVQAVTRADLAGLPLGPRIANALLAYGAYLRDAVWPADLGLFYAHPWLPGGEPPSSLHVAGIALALAVLSLIVFRSGRAYAVVGWCWFLGTLVPVIGIVQVGAQGRADRYTYLPLVGLWIAIAFGFREWFARHRSRAASRSLVALASLSVAVYGALAWVQLGHWRDSVTVYTRAIAVEPRAAIIETNLAVLYMDSGERALAQEHFERALEIDPDRLFALGNLGVLLRSQMEFAAAEPVLRRALAVEPDYHAARANLAWALAAQGKLRAARVELETLFAREPDHALGRRVLGMTLEASGDARGARRAYERALELDPSAANHSVLGEHLVRQGDLTAGLASLREARRLGFDPPSIATSIGRALLEAGRPAEALAEFQRALAADPEYLPARRGLKRARAALGG